MAKVQIPEEKAPFPFSMIEAMMPRYPWIAVMGWAFVLISLLIGIFGLSPAVSTFLSDSKAVREAAVAGSAFVNANVTAHVIESWVPQFKFVGLGLGLMAITMALGTIAKRLRRMGFVITGHIREDLRPKMPPIPRRVRYFQLSTLMGVMILVAAFIIGVVLALTAVPDYWSHSIANELNTAQPGSALLQRLETVSSFAKWLNPLRMLGMAFLFTAITVALTVIIGTLQGQAKLLIGFFNRATSG
jgi:hypothetical protein